MARSPKPRPKPQPARLDEAQVGGTHYASMAVTPWQFLEACMTPDELRGKQTRGMEGGDALISL